MADTVKSRAKSLCTLHTKYITKLELSCCNCHATFEERKKELICKLLEDFCLVWNPIPLDLLSQTVGKSQLSDFTVTFHWLSRDISWYHAIQCDWENLLHQQLHKSQFQFQPLTYFLSSLVHHPASSSVFLQLWEIFVSFSREYGTFFGLYRWQISKLFFSLFKTPFVIWYLNVTENS